MAESAARLAAFGRCIVKVTLADGTAVNLPTEEAAAEYARQSGGQSYTLEIRKPSALAGTGADAREELDALHRRYGIPEFILDIPTTDPATRLNALELLAAAPLSRAA